MPDLDPRLAVGPLLASGSPAEIARAVIDEWLKAPASPAMMAKIEDECAVSCLPRDDETWGVVYVSMCAQAAKEIA